MVYGGIGQRLNVKKLPEGIKMARTGYKFNIPSSGSWWPSIDDGGNKNSTVSPPGVYGAVSYLQQQLTIQL